MVFTIINLCVIIFIIGDGIYYDDITNWTESPGGFFPYGFTGVSRIPVHFCDNATVDYASHLVIVCFRAIKVQAWKHKINSGVAAGFKLWVATRTNYLGMIQRSLRYIVRNFQNQAREVHAV